VGAPIVQDTRVGIVSFTGSAPTGKLVQKMVSERALLGKVCL
jgi:acyl-CoA reductase-like NAD-dependent aldehyde dehydrogenase